MGISIARHIVLIRILKFGVPEEARGVGIRTLIREDRARSSTGGKRN